MTDRNKLLIILSLSLIFLLAETAQISKKKTYVVHMDKSAMPSPYTNHLQWYSSKIDSVMESKSVEQEGSRILYTYQTTFHGLAARLTAEEAERLEEEAGVVAVIPETRYELHTTRSPTFLGLERRETESVWAERVTDHDVIVGVLDTGIWPESQSFNDTGMSPVPSSWRGACETGKRFLKHNCNRKIVGARVFYRGYEAATGKIDEELEYRSPRDRDGHGTHTAATVAGSPVGGANLLGFASGTARGMAPRARVAAYKVCWVGGCFSSDILSAVDQAVADGVKVLSISLGGGMSTYYRDSLAIATFGAMEMGVFVSCSAGNGGPDPLSLTNVSPWITTVGASTMDRDFPATVKLGIDKRTFKGVSLYKGITVLSRNKQYPLVYLGRNASSPDPTSFCLDGALDSLHVAGKIVICDRGVTPRVQKGQVVKRAGGIGMILTNTATNGEELVADSHMLPTVAVGETEGRVIKQYAMRSKRPTATLEILGTRIGIKPSPVVAAFSSRGPNFLSLEILKPDLVAPGVNILAAWSGDMAPSSLSSDRRRVKFNILSGTSMSCPHVSGVAALIRSRHPDWSPAAVKSALMTTAYVHDNMLKPLKDASGAVPSTPYDHGAGHIDPLKAIDPGLVYDIGPHDYFDFLCTQDLSPAQLKVFTKHSNRSCKHNPLANNPGNLNYPAISALFPENKHVRTMTLTRTVTNVGPHISSYKVSMSPFKGAFVTVQPKTLNFTSKHQKLSYTVTFRTKLRMKRPEFGGLLWKSATHKVRSPVIITWLPPL